MGLAVLCSVESQYIYIGDNLVLLLVYKTRYGVMASFWDWGASLIDTLPLLW